MVEGEHPLRVRRTPTAQPVREIPGGCFFLPSFLAQLPILPFSETARSIETKTLRDRNSYNRRRAMVFASTKVEGGCHLLRNRLCRSSKSSKAKTNGGRSLRMINQIGNDGRKSKRIKEEKREEERIAVVVLVVVGTGVV